METLVSILVGLVGGFVTSLYFAWQSGKELRAESAELRKLLNITLRVLADAGMVDLVQDEHGNVTGRYVDLKATGAIRSTGTATLTTTQETTGFAQGKSASHAEAQEAAPDPPDRESS